MSKVLTQQIFKFITQVTTGLPLELQNVYLLAEVPGIRPGCNVVI